MRSDARFLLRDLERDLRVTACVKNELRSKNGGASGYGYGRLRGVRGVLLYLPLLLTYILYRN